MFFAPNHGSNGKFQHVFLPTMVCFTDISFNFCKKIFILHLPAKMEHIKIFFHLVLLVLDLNVHVQDVSQLNVPEMIKHLSKEETKFVLAQFRHFVAHMEACDGEGNCFEISVKNINECSFSKPFFSKEHSCFVFSKSVLDFFQILLNWLFVSTRSNSNG